MIIDRLIAYMYSLCLQRSEQINGMASSSKINGIPYISNESGGKGHE